MPYRRIRHLFAASALIFYSSGLEAQSLRQQADTLGISIGTAVRPSLLSERLYAATLGREFNMVEPEDAMKWAVIRRERSTFDFTGGDRVLAFAQVHRMKDRGHTLVWPWSNPAWLTSQSFTPEQLSQILQEHITTVVTHFRGKVFAWDVVNEAFDEHGALKHSPWYDQPGIGLAAKSSAYIEQALRWAHAADPQALLFYNDHGAETINVKSETIYAMVKDFRQRGVPIDGVGMQMHIFDLRPDVDGIAASIARFAALGLRVHITEMDVALPVDASGHASAADLAQQAEIYRRIAAACLAQGNCTAIQTWGFTDKYSWIGWKSKGSQGQALPFDRNYRPKAAYGGLRDALHGGQKPASASVR